MQNPGIAEPQKSREEQPPRKGTPPVNPDEDYDEAQRRKFQSNDPLFKLLQQFLVKPKRR